MIKVNGSRVLLVLLLSVMLPCHVFSFIRPRLPASPRIPSISRTTPAATSSSTSTDFSIIFSRDAKALEDFKGWLTTNGLDLTSASLELRQAEGIGLCLWTIRPIEKDEILLSIPQQIIFTPTLPTSSLEKAANAAKLDPIGRLALRLSYEASRGYQSLWAPYLRVLPSLEEMDLLMSWEEDKILELLATSPLYDDIREAQDSAKTELEILRQSLLLQKQGEDILMLLPLLQWKHWMWAKSIAMSRPYVMDQDDDATLQLIPLIDMANHGDHIGYAVQKGDGVFTSRSDIQLVADRSYPEAGVQFYVTYGPLNSVSKFYSFGYLERLQISSSVGQQKEEAEEKEEEELVVPAQGTAAFLLSLDGGRQEDEIELRRWKEEVLAVAGLSSPSVKGGMQRIEVGTRTALEDGPGLARVQVEDDDAMDRLKRYLRLKHLIAEEVMEVWGSDGKGVRAGVEASVWEALADPQGGQVELAMALEIVRMCGEGLERAQGQLMRAQEMMQEVMKKEEEEEEEEEEKERYEKRLMLILTLLHGEMLALRAVAELIMEALEEAEEEE